MKLLRLILLCILATQALLPAYAGNQPGQAASASLPAVQPSTPTLRVYLDPPLDSIPHRSPLATATHGAQTNAQPSVNTAHTQSQARRSRVSQRLRQILRVGAEAESEPTYERVEKRILTGLLLVVLALITYVTYLIGIGMVLAGIEQIDEYFAQNLSSNDRITRRIRANKIYTRVLGVGFYGSVGILLLYALMLVALLFSWVFFEMGLPAWVGSLAFYMLPFLLLLLVISFFATIFAYMNSQRLLDVWREREQNNVPSREVPANTN